MVSNTSRTFGTAGSAAPAAGEQTTVGAVPLLPLKTGSTIPQLGYGTYKIAPEETTQLVHEAILCGYRHIDTAQMYGNEAQVGQAIKRAATDGVSREELFVTTKLNNQNHERADVLTSFEQSLRDLGTEYVDLFLIHWPLPGMYDGRYDLTWQHLIELYEGGRARQIGVSNFQPEHLERIVDATGFVPHVNQVEAHPYFANAEAREATRALGAVVEAWAPLARGRVLDEPAILAAAQRLERTPAQVVLRWAIERGDVVFPKTATSDRLQQNLEIFDFALDAEAKSAIDALDQGEDGRTGKHPAQANFIV